jgi:hypothetical protein
MRLALKGYTVPEGIRGLEGSVSVPGIGVGHLTTIEQPMAGAVHAPFDLHLFYSDVAGKRWTTTANFEIGMASRYENLSISATDIDDFAL